MASTHLAAADAVPFAFAGTSMTDHKFSMHCYCFIGKSSRNAEQVYYEET